MLFDQFKHMEMLQLTVDFTREATRGDLFFHRESRRACKGPCLQTLFQDGSLNKPSSTVRKYFSAYYIPPSTTTPPIG